MNKRPDGRLKDTWLNIQRTGEFVVNLTDEPLARAMHDSSWRLPPNVGEPDYLGLKLAPSVDVKPPRLADAPWSMECKTWQVINVKDDRQLVIGEGVRFHIRDELWDLQGDARPHGAVSSGRAHVRRPLLPHRRPHGVSAAPVVAGESGR